MSLLLHIDTALETSSVCLTEDQTVLGLLENPRQTDAAAWLHPAIERLLKDNGRRIEELNAVSVTIGPGSYTGLRVGLAAAKGICYARQLPLIAVNTLQVMAKAVLSEASDLIVPLIDARRMEVFTATYNRNLEEIDTPRSLVLEAESFSALLQQRHVLFCGSGVTKWMPLVNAGHAVFSLAKSDASHLAMLAHPLYSDGRFSDLAYSEPLYLKEFYTVAPRK